MRVQLVDFQNQAITANQDFLIAQNTLKGLLRVRPMVELVLKGELDYTAVALDLEGLRAAALVARSDVLAKTRNVSQKDANLKLALAFQVPDVTLGGDYGIQGPQGPNTPNQYGFGLSVPLPLFNRNQGGFCRPRPISERRKPIWRRPACRRKSMLRMHIVILRRPRCW